MLKLVTIVGARPQFVKAAPVSAAWRMRHVERLVHTGQHYDAAMSDVFFAELGIPEPEIRLHAGSGGHGAQTARMLEPLEAMLLDERPDAVLVFGDTNSTLAGALAAAKLHIPVAHVEAGLRSFNRRMPEEINRVVTDHLATWHFCTSPQAAQQLAREGIAHGVHVVGDVMLDALLMARERSRSAATLDALALVPQEFVLATVHRAENTDDPRRLRAIIAGLAAVGCPVVLPIHPRTRDAMARSRIDVPSTIRIIDPLGYLDTVALLGAARACCTDSGGMQKEAYWIGTPCITMRDETEWTETVTEGWNTVTGADADRIADAARAATRRPTLPRTAYGDPGAAARLCDILASDLEGRALAA